MNGRMLPASHPILSREESLAFEANLFNGDEARAWPVMVGAGRAVAAAVLDDIREIGGLPGTGRLLLLAGKGNNAGDGFLAARALLERSPESTIDVILAYGERTLRPLARRAWRELLESSVGRVRFAGTLSAFEARPPALSRAYDVCLDGIFGLQYRAPLDRRAAEVLGMANGLPVRLRAAIDLPSGLDDPGGFKADFTYATGILKSPLLGCANAGRLRYLDLGFFGLGSHAAGLLSRVLTADALAPLAGLRPAHSDKRSFGHLCIVAGSLGFPGAALMAVRAALRSGAGLVTAVVPESLVPAFASAAPEAMWVGWPETKDGGLARPGRRRILSAFERATAVVVGPGLGDEPETLAAAADVVGSLAVPVLLDADALRTKVVRAARSPLVLTPHAGEYARIGGGGDLPGFCKANRAVVVLKGPVTRISRGVPATVFHSVFGGPVLARGGSGDVLSGLVGGLLAQTPGDPLAAACRGVVWHGMAADALARSRGQTAVTLTQLLEFLPEALRAPLMPYSC
jgi:NAD(P)H-hydrate epimerase